MSDVQSFLNRLMGDSAQSFALPRRRPLALAWARVSTEKQHEKGLSIRQQLQEIRRYAEAQGMEIVGEYEEAASAFRHQEKRHEFQKMLNRARAERDVSIVIVHDLSRFCRDSRVAKNLIEDLRKAGVTVLSVT